MATASAVVMAGVPVSLLGPASPAAAVPSVGLNQPLTPLSSGSRGTARPLSVRQVIQNRVDYGAFFGGKPPARPVIDFNSQDVLALSMGNQPTGGYSIKINSVVVNTAGPNAGVAVVHLGETVPIPGAPRLGGPTQPFTVVAVPKGPLLYEFMDDLPQNFSTLKYEEHNTRTGANIKLTLSGDGTGSLQGRAFTATDSQMQGLYTTLNSTNPFTLPQKLPKSGNIVFSLEGKSGPNNFSTSGSPAPQVIPLINLFHEIEDGVTNPPPLGIAEIKLTIGDVNSPYIETDTVNLQNNTFNVNRSLVGGSGTDSTVTLTEAQLGDFVFVFRAHLLGHEDNVFVRPPGLPLGISPATLMTTQSNGVVHIIDQGAYGFNDPSQPFARMNPLEDAFVALRPMAMDLNTGTPVTGIVTHNADGTVNIGNFLVNRSDPFLPLIAAQVGNTVTVDGQSDGAQLHVYDIQGSLGTGAVVSLYPTLYSQLGVPFPAGTPVVVKDMNADIGAGPQYRVAAGSGEGYVQTGLVNLTLPTKQLVSLSIVGLSGFSLASLDLGRGGSAMLGVVAHYDDGSTADVTGTVTWNSTDPTVATVSNAGIVVAVLNAVKEGTATITASLGSISASIAVTVTPAVPVAITVTGSLILAPGDVSSLTAIATYVDGTTQDVSNDVQTTWSSSDPSIVAMSAHPISANVASGVAPGTATVTATYLGVSGSTVVTVTAPAPPDLGITKTHVGNVTQGLANVQYTINVSNVGSGPTSGVVTVTDLPGPGLSVVNMTGSGWGCNATVCTRPDPLLAGGAYSPITVVTNVANTAPGLTVNTATVTTPGDSNPANDSVADPTIVNPSTPPPAISAVSPGSGPLTGGTVMTITGTGFLTGSIVNVGASLATITAQSATSIIVTAPASATPGPFDVSVTNPDGQTSVATGAFTYVAPPTILGLTPSTGPGSGGTAVTIVGIGFQPGATVRFGAFFGTVTVVSSGSITVVTPPGVGSVTVTVINPDGQAAFRLLGFTYF